MSSANNDETHKSHDHTAEAAEAGMSSIDLTTTTNDLTNDLTTTDDFDPTSLANAEHLDRLEASEADLDIASFQDIELPPNDTTPQSPTRQSQQQSSGVGPSSPINATSNTIRRAKRYYYCLPMMTQYKFVIIGCFCMFGLLLVAVGFASSLKRSNNNAASKATNMAGEEKKGAVVIDDAPDYDNNFGTVDNEWGEGEEWTDGYDEWEGGNDGGWGGGQGGGEELGNGVEDTSVTDSPTEAPSEGGEVELILVEVAMEAKVTDPPPTDAPRGSPSPTITPTAMKMTPSPTTDKPTEPLPLNPQWFQTSGAQYQTYLANHNAAGGDAANDHSHILSALFCIKQNLFLCSYNEYCPNGQGTDPYQGGPKTATWNTADSIEPIQWAPIVTTETNAQTSSAGGHWVQVGTIPESDEGNEDNDFGKCWTWGEWSGGGEGSKVDLEVEWGEDHRRWILCCTKKEEDEGWGDDR